VSVLGRIQSSRLRLCLRVQLGASSEPSWESKSSRLGVYNEVQSGVYFRAYLGACKEPVHLTVLINAACIVSRAHNCLCIILIYSTCKSIGLHSSTGQIYYGLLSQRLLFYELRVA